MKTIQVGYSRIYNASGCFPFDRDQCFLRFHLGNIHVEAYIGPNLKHSVLTAKISPPRPTDVNARGCVSRAQGSQYPPPEKFPADAYTELIATQSIEVSNELAAAFQQKEAAARNEILRRAKENKAPLTSALNFVAGVLGLRLHYLLVRTPITEQWYAYRDKSTSYAREAGIKFNALEAYKCDISDKGILAIRSRIPVLQREWTLTKAGSVLAWLLSAWAAEDPVLEFVSLFIPLECVIPELPQVAERSLWDQKKSEILAIIKKEADVQARKELKKFVKNLQLPPPSLASRFEKWAAEKALSGWEKDVEAFKRFCRMRNDLVHAGESEVEFSVTVAVDDVRTLEDIAERYVSLSLFGDADVYQSPKRTARL